MTKLLSLLKQIYEPVSQGRFLVKKKIESEVNPFCAGTLRWVPRNETWTGLVDVCLIGHKRSAVGEPATPARPFRNAARSFAETGDNDNVNRRNAVVSCAGGRR